VVKEREGKIEGKMISSLQKIKIIFLTFEGVFFH